MHENMLATPLDGLLVEDASVAEEATPRGPLSLDAFDRVLNACEDAAYAVGDWRDNDDEPFSPVADDAAAKRAAVYDAYQELLESYEGLVRRSAEEADRAQALVLRKEEEIAAHDDLHRAAADRIAALVRETRRLEACLRAVEAERDQLRKRLSETEGERDRAVSRLVAVTNAHGASL